MQIASLNATTGDAELVLHREREMRKSAGMSSG